MKTENKKSKNAGKPEEKKKSINGNRNEYAIRQQRFIDKYLETGSGAEAAIYAGYSAKTASSRGCQLLKDVKVREEISKRLEESKKESIATGQEVMEYYTKVMRGEILDQFGLEAPLQERTKAATELAKRTVDVENRMNGKPDGLLEIKLDWSRDKD